MAWSISGLQGLVVAVLVVGLAGMQSFARTSPSEAGEPFVAVDAAVQNAKLGPGVNVLGYDPVWREPSTARFTPQHFQLVRKAGFGHVRLVVHSFDFIDAEGKLDPQWLATLDGYVKAALDQGLNVILDDHDFSACGKDAVICRTKLAAFWSAIAPRYKDAPNRLLFEILNEPHGAITPVLWNQMLVEMLAIIRTTNPTRNVVIGPANWNGLESLPLLLLPDGDRHIIVTFHYYQPMAFTHQGAAFAGPSFENRTGVVWGTPEETKFLNDKFDLVKQWSVTQDRPIYLGEFGVYDRAAMSERVKWTKAVVAAANTRGFSWAWWQFDPDFVLWDFSKPGWVKPLLKALIPSAKTD